MVTVRLCLMKTRQNLLSVNIFNSQQMLSIDPNEISYQGMTQQLFLVPLTKYLSFVYSRLIIHHFHLITPQQVDWHTTSKFLYMQSTSSLASQHQGCIGGNTQYNMVTYNEQGNMHSPGNFNKKHTHTCILFGNILCGILFCLSAVFRTFHLYHLFEHR